jgi:hypothetical protein
MGNKITQPRLKKNVDFDLETYVNTETGELLSSALGKDKLSVSITEKGDYVVMSSDDYVVLDSETVRFLSNELSRSELSNVLLMATDLKTPLNLVYNGPQPHSNESLQSFLGYSSRDKFFKLLKKLMELGVLYQIKGRISGELRVVYMLNPYIARKRKTIDNTVFNVFQTFIK